MSFPFLAARVLELCQSCPDHCALVNAANGEKFSYGDLYRHVAGARARIRERGVGTGDRVMLAADRTFAFIFAYLAIHSLGAVAVPLDSRSPQAAVTRISGIVEPGLILWPDGAAPDAMDIMEFMGASDEPIELNIGSSSSPADIMFTSGTTGEPKGVLLDHGNIASSINNINRFIGNTGEDIELCPMPLSHSFGIARVRCNLYAGGTIVLEDGVSNPRHLFSSLDVYGITGLSMVGPAWTMLRRLSGERIGRFRNQLKYFELGSAPLEAEVKAELAALLPHTHVCMHYGLTEASRAAFLDFHDSPQHLKSVGRQSPLCEIRIFSPEGEALAPGESGEVGVRGPMVCKTYLDPSQNAGAWHDDFFRTGDIGWLDADGYLHLTGRIKEMINVGGEKVAPNEVESCLNSLPQVRESACVGAPHPVLGERVAAFVVAEDGQAPDLDHIREALKGKLEPYKIPVALVIVEELPRTVSGKIKRGQLKDLL